MQGCAHFLEIFAKFLWAPDFVEFVLGGFSCFYIEIAYSNLTFCGASQSVHVQVKNVEISAKQPRQTIFHLNIFHLNAI